MTSLPPRTSTGPSPSPSPPALEFVGRVEAMVDKDRVEAKHQVEPNPRRLGEFEYVLIARVPSLEIEARGKNQLAVTLFDDRYHVVFHADPSAAGSLDDRFILSSVGAGAGRYRQEKTVRDDKVPGDALTTLQFTELLPGLDYTLEWWRDREHKVTVFQNLPFAALMETSLDDGQGLPNQGEPELAPVAEAPPAEEPPYVLAAPESPGSSGPGGPAPAPPGG